MIGCGAIGREIAKAIDDKRIDAELAIVYDKYEDAMDSLSSSLNNKPKKANAIDDIFKEEIDVVVEAASQDALRSYAEDVLKHTDLMAMSIGALLDQSLLDRLIKITKEYNTRLYIPSGAIAGIDAIKSVKALVDEVMITTTKHPKGLKDAPYVKQNNINLDTLSEAKIIYEGHALDAVKAFPANVNVAATLSLASIGASKVKVRVIADPKIDTNRHEIIVRGRFGEFNIRVDNIPSPNNPKTSYLAILSAIECLKSINARVRIGT